MLRGLSFTKQSPSTATPEELAVLQGKLGVVLPPAFVEFCSRWNGGFPAKGNEFYPVPKSCGEFFGEYGKDAKGLVVSVMLGITSEFPPCSLLDEYNLTNEGSDLGIIPIATDLFGNQVVLRSEDPAGLIYWRDQDLWEMPPKPQPGPQFADRPRLIPIAQDLESFYNSLTSDPDATW